MAETLIVGVAGRRGCGKSTLMRALLEGCWRLVVWDPMAEHDWCPNRVDSLQRFEMFLAWAEGRQAFACRYVPEGDLTDEFGPVADLVYDYGDLVFGVEEVPMLCTPSSLPYEFDRLVRLGRHQKVSLIWTAQRMVEVARRLTAATDYFALFSHTEPRDLDGIAERCGAQVARAVAELPRHDYLVWDAVEGKGAPLAKLVQELNSTFRGLSRGMSRNRGVTIPVTSSNRQASGVRGR